MFHGNGSYVIGLIWEGNGLQTRMGKSCKTKLKRRSEGALLNLSVLNF